MAHSMNEIQEYEAGYEARMCNLPLDQTKSADWVDGWLCADRELMEEI